MSKFVITGQLDYVNFYAPSLPFRDIPGKYGCRIAPELPMRSIDGDEVRVELGGHHHHLDGTVAEGYRASRSDPPIIIGVPDKIVNKCREWNTTPDRFLCGCHGEIAVRQYQIQTKFRPERSWYFALIAVRVTSEIKLPSDSEVFDILSSKNPALAFGSLMK